MSSALKLNCNVLPNDSLYISPIWGLSRVPYKKGYKDVGPCWGPHIYGNYHICPVGPPQILAEAHSSCDEAHIFQPFSDGRLGPCCYIGVI